MGKGAHRRKRGEMLWEAIGKQERWREEVKGLGGGQGVTCGHRNGGHDGPLEVQLWE